MDGGSILGEISFVLSAIFGPMLSGDLTHWNGLHYVLFALIVVGAITYALKRS